MRISGSKIPNFCFPGLCSYISNHHIVVTHLSHSVALNKFFCKFMVHFEFIDIELRKGNVKCGLKFLEETPSNWCYKTNTDKKLIFFFLNMMSSQNDVVGNWDSGNLGSSLLFNNRDS